MKVVLGILSLVLLPIIGFSQGITFENGSFQDALEKAKAEEKVLFIDGYAIWCGPCKKMDKTVFQEEKVGNYFDQNLIALKVDVERGEGPELKKRLNIEGLPGYVFLDGDGNVIYRFSAAMPTDEFLKEVTLAVSYAKDPNSLGRLNEVYEEKKNDENFLAIYLEQLHKGKSTGYADVLEHYLDIQKSVADSSQAMVLLLAKHHKEVVLGGNADRIIAENLGTESWKKYVRKDIREIYQKLPKDMIVTTTEYAVTKNDSTYLELALNAAALIGAPSDEAQKNRLYEYFYFKTGNGPAYKARVRPGIEAYAKSLDVADLRATYLDWEQKKAAGDLEALQVRPYAVRKSQDLAGMASMYAGFVESDLDKKDILRWIDIAYQIVPGDGETLNQYADYEYLFGNQEKAIQMKQEAIQISQKAESKKVEGMKVDLEIMKEGGELTLTL